MIFFAKDEKIAKIDHFKAVDAILTMMPCAPNRFFSLAQLESLGQSVITYYYSGANPITDILEFRQYVFQVNCVRIKRRISEWK